MSDGGDRFVPRPRSTGDARGSTDRRNLADELARVERRLAERVIGTPRTEFSDGAASYDAASMVVVRLFGLLERPDASGLRERLTPDEFAALRTIRNIVAHGGYATMNDEVFWLTATRDLPDIVARLRTA
ncbi:hypothetical protein [Agromyces italicus]|uniref:hypothetical protein n=1 Tax=Agromyces italicus TaxID=279572 RepID=UPI0003B5E3EB|nr:hypothetical protein [Agromyces italicus]